jgi:hypothetical protein
MTLPRGRLLLAGICGLYLLLVVPTSLMIPAYEANDEPEHVRYVERIVLHGQLPASRSRTVMNHISRRSTTSSRRSGSACCASRSSSLSP